MKSIQNQPRAKQLVWEALNRVEESRKNRANKPKLRRIPPDSEVDDDPEDAVIPTFPDQVWDTVLAALSPEKVGRLRSRRCQEAICKLRQKDKQVMTRDEFGVPISGINEALTSAGIPYRFKTPRGKSVTKGGDQVCLMPTK